MKKAMLIETLEAMHDNAWECAKIWEEDGDEVMAAKSYAEMIAIDSVIKMMKDESYAQKIRGIFFTEDGMRK